MSDAYAYEGGITLRIFDASYGLIAGLSPTWPTAEPPRRAKATTARHGSASSSMSAGSPPALRSPTSPLTTPFAPAFAAALPTAAGA